MRDVAALYASVGSTACENYESCLREFNHRKVAAGVEFGMCVPFQTSG